MENLATDAILLLLKTNYGVDIIEANLRNSEIRNLGVIVANIPFFQWLHF